jgi:hypothetical protein
MCDCVKRICNDIREGEFSKKNPEYAKLNIIDAGCDLSGWIFGKKSVNPTLFIPFTITHEPIGRKKTTAVKMIAKYCPFCGEKADKEDA